MGCFFFFSSRRRHTRCLSDWSSDVCSSDLEQQERPELRGKPVGIVPVMAETTGCVAVSLEAKRSEERREGKSVDLGGRRIMERKKAEKRREKPNHERKGDKCTNRELQTVNQ